MHIYSQSSKKNPVEAIGSGGIIVRIPLSYLPKVLYKLPPELQSSGIPQDVWYAINLNVYNASKSFMGFRMGNPQHECDRANNAYYQGRKVFEFAQDQLGKSALIVNLGNISPLLVNSIPMQHSVQGQYGQPVQYAQYPPMPPQQVQGQYAGYQGYPGYPAAVVAVAEPMQDSGQFPIKADVYNNNQPIASVTAVNYQYPNNAPVLAAVVSNSNSLPPAQQQGSYISTPSQSVPSPNENVWSANSSAAPAGPQVGSDGNVWGVTSSIAP